MTDFKDFELSVKGVIKNKEHILVTSNNSSITAHLISDSYYLDKYCFKVFDEFGNEIFQLRLNEIKKYERIDEHQINILTNTDEITIEVN